MFKIIIKNLTYPIQIYMYIYVCVHTLPVYLCADECVCVFVSLCVCDSIKSILKITKNHECL